MRAPHRIRRQRWQVDAPDPDTAFAVRQRLRRELDGTLLPAFERAFDALADGEEVIRIPRLELRLTVGDLDELAAALPAAIEQALVHALSKAESDGTAGAARLVAHPAMPGVAARHSAAADRLAMLLHYLANGNLGWAHAAGAAVETASILRRTAVEWTTDWECVRHAAPAEPTAAFGFFFRLLQLLDASGAARLVAAAARSMLPGLHVRNHPTPNRAKGQRRPPESAVPGQHRRLCRQAARLAVAAAAVAPDATAWATLTAYFGAEDARDLPPPLPPPDAETAPNRLQAPTAPAGGEVPVMAVRGTAETRSPGAATAEPPPAKASEGETQVSSQAPNPSAPEAKDGSPDTAPPAAGTLPAREASLASDAGDDGQPSPGLRKETPFLAAPTADPPTSAHGERSSARTIGPARNIPQPAASAPAQAHTRPWVPESPPREADAPALHVYAAGLVLLHPFLSLLFRERGLLADDEDCLPAASLPRAAALLHWLATGRDAPYEFELGCIKVLLGLAPADPLPVAEGLLDEADRVECAALLDSALRHWSALGSTSIDGLRLSFLQRQGLLRSGETGWQLQLESEPFDMLLARLPWGIGIVRLPWMTRPIFTDWPTP